MLNRESVAAVEAARFGSRFVCPLYDTYGFARISATLERLLTGAGAAPLPAAALAGLAARYETIVLIVVDGFGWRFFAPWAERHPLLRRFMADGVVSRLTTMFPSTTAAHVTALHTGLDPAASGVFEWFLYEPGVGRMVAPLLFSFAGDRARETLLAAGVDPGAIFPADTLYRRLAARGVATTVYQDHTYARSPATGALCAGAEVASFRTLPEALVRIAGQLAADLGPTLHHLYIDTVDTIAHLYGPESPHVEAQIDSVLTAIERVLHPALADLGRPALLLLTADHGQIAIDPGRAHLVDRLVPWLREATPTGADGRPLAPAGSSRDLFLHVRPERLDAVHAALGEALAGLAEVHRADDLVASGLFGPAPSPALHARMADLVVLPFPGETVWWDDPRFRIVFRGLHGGLSPEEAHTQIAALAYGPPSSRS